MLDRTWQNCVLPEDLLLNLVMPPLANEDQEPAPAFSLWPFLVVQVMTEGPCLAMQAMAKHIIVFFQQDNQSDHALPCKVMTKGNTDIHNLAMPCCASND